MAPGGLTICEIDPRVLDNLKVELLDTKPVVIEPSTITKLSCEGAAKYSFAKNGDKWELAGEPSFRTDAAAIMTVLNAIRDLRVRQYARYSEAKPADYGLDKPAAVLSLEPDTGDAVNLAISAVGPKGSADRYASLRSNPGRVFVIKAEDAVKLIKTVPDFQSKT